CAKSSCCKKSVSASQRQRSERVAVSILPYKAEIGPRNRAGISVGENRICAGWWLPTGGAQQCMHGHRIAAQVSLHPARPSQLHAVHCAPGGSLYLSNSTRGLTWQRDERQRRGAGIGEWRRSGAIARLLADCSRGSKARVWSARAAVVSRSGAE